MTERTEFDPAYGWKRVWQIDIAYPAWIIEPMPEHHNLVQLDTQTGRGFGTQVKISKPASKVEYDGDEMYIREYFAIVNPGVVDNG